MQEVNVCFSTQGGWFSWLLRKAMGIPASHCMITYKSSAFRNTMVVEVQGRGLVIVPWQKWSRKNKLVARYRIDLPDECMTAGLTRVGGLFGSEYDLRVLFGHILLRFGLSRTNLFNHRDKLVCSEQVAEFLCGAGLPLGKIADVTPKDLLLIAEGSREIFRRMEQAPGLDRQLEQARRRGEKKPIHAGFGTEQLVAPPPS